MQYPQRVASRVVGDAVREDCTNVLEAQMPDEEFGQLEHPRCERLDLSGEGRVSVRQAGIEVPYRSDAGRRRRDHHLRIGEHTDESPSEFPRLVAVTGIEVHLPAAGLLSRKVDRVTKPL